MFPMTVTIHNEVQFRAIAAAMGTLIDAADSHAVGATRPEPKAARAKAAKGEPLTAPEAAAALDGHSTPEAKAETPAPAPAPAKAEAPAALTYEAVAAVVTKVARMKSRDAAVAVLATFGASSLKDVTPDRYAQVVAACEEALK